MPPNRTIDLFAAPEPKSERLAEDATLLRRHVLDEAPAILAGVQAIAAASPFRRMMTPGGFTMSAAMTNCGAAGWVTDRTGYRYDAADPETGRAWPPMPPLFRRIAAGAAAEAGFADFAPDACLINYYEPGARMSLHQDRNERDFGQPILSVSLGLAVTFQFGGPTRADPVRRVVLRHGDVVVWGGRARLFYHGVLVLKEGDHPATGRARINLTFRRAL